MKKIAMFNVIAQVLFAAACCAAEPRNAFEQLGESAEKLAIAMPCMCLPSACPSGCGQIVIPAAEPVYQFPGSDPVEMSRNKSGGAIPAGMARVYLAQPELKKLLAAHFTAAGDVLKARLLAEKSVRLFADGKAVYIVQNKTVTRLEDPELAARAYAALSASGLGQVPQNKLLIEAGIVGAIGCMTSDDCWGAVGDGVSAVSQWWNS